MSVNLIINGYNAKEKWGVTTTTATLSALLAPNTLKDNPVFNSRLKHGSRIDVSDPKVASRDLTIEIHLRADNPTQFYKQQEEFYAELEKGKFTLALSDRPDVIYHLIYTSCSQYTQFCRGIATLSLRCTEPNPKDRTKYE